MPEKEFKTVEEQIEILRSRGLTISDEAKAKDFLTRNNYYRISGYSLTLRSHDVFYKGATFQNIIDIYSFDYELRHVLLKHIEQIEVTVKSVYAHEFARIHGPTGYLDPRYFCDETEYRKIMAKAEEQIKNRLPHEAYLKHYVEELKQPIPLWAFVDLLTIKDISVLIKITEQDVKNAVAAQIGIKKHGAKMLPEFMHGMTIVRNLCAHGGRIYNRNFHQKPRLNREEKALLREEHGLIDYDHLFGFILIMRRLLKPEEFQTMKTEIVCLTEKYPFVSMRYYGFPDNWNTAL